MKVTSHEQVLRSEVQVEIPNALEDADISFYRDGVPIRVSKTRKSRSLQELHSSGETLKRGFEVETGHGHEERISLYGDSRPKRVFKTHQSCNFKELRSSRKGSKRGSGHEEEGNSASLLDITTSVDRLQKFCSLKELFSFVKGQTVKCNQRKPASRKLPITKICKSKGQDSDFQGGKIVGGKRLSMKDADFKEVKQLAHSVQTPKSSTSGNETSLKANDIDFIEDISSTTSKARDEFTRSKKSAVSGYRIEITRGKRRRKLTDILLEARLAGEANQTHDFKVRKRRYRKLLASSPEGAALGPPEPVDGQLYSTPTAERTTTSGDSHLPLPLRTMKQTLRSSSAAGLNSRLQVDAQHQVQSHEGMHEYALVGVPIDVHAEDLQRMARGRLEHADDRIFTKSLVPYDCKSAIRCRYDFRGLEDHVNYNFSCKFKHDLTEVAEFLHTVAMSSEGVELADDGGSEDIPVPPSSSFALISRYICRQPGDQETSIEIDCCNGSRKYMKCAEATNPNHAEGEEVEEKTLTNFSISSNYVLLDPADQIKDKERAEWKYIRRNIFLCRQRRKKNCEIMICQCRPPRENQAGCGDGCLNRLLNIECNQELCPCGASCSNQRFQKQKYVAVEIFECGKKGYGLKVLENVCKDTFLMEYVGEVLDTRVRAAREQDYIRQGREHLYFMSLSRTQTIDACLKGNFGRFINHSCEPNCKTEKWMVDGDICIGLFAIRDLEKGEEITIDYNYVFVRGLCVQKCECGHGNCRGYIGVN